MKNCSHITQCHSSTTGNGDKTSPYPQCKGGLFPDSAPRRPPSVARSGHVNHAQTTPLSICLQNQPATTGKAETLPDISAERRVGTDNVFTRRHPQPRFYTVHSATPSSLKCPSMAVSAVPLPIIIVMTLSAVPAGFYAPRVRHPVRIAADI